MKPNLIACLVFLVCFVAACNRSPVKSPNNTRLPADVLAIVEGSPVRLADYEAELQRRVRGHSEHFAQPEARQALLSELVNSESIYLRARQTGFDQKPEIVRQLKQFIIDRFVEEQWRDRSGLPPVSEAEIDSYYRDHPDRFAIPEKIRFAFIEFAFSSKATDSKKDEVLQKAKAVLAEARSSNASERTFGALAQRYSEDQATRYAGGDAGWVSRGESSRWAPAVIDAAFALANPGDLAPVITTANGCYLVKLIERRSSGHRPLAEVAEAIRYQLAVGKRQRAQQDFYESMKAGLKIEINHALLNSLPAPISRPDSTPPAIPGT